MRRSGLTLLLSAGLTSACVDSGRSLEWPTGYRVAFLVQLDAGSADISGPYLDPSETDLAFSAQSDLLFVGLTAAQLAAAYPQLDEEGLASVRLGPATELAGACGDDGYLHLDDTLEIPAAGRVDVFVVGPSGFVPTSPDALDGLQLQLRASASGSSCVTPASIEWTAFVDGQYPPKEEFSTLFGDSIMDLNFDQAFYLDADTAVADIRPGLLVARRGQPFRRDDGHLNLSEVLNLRGHVLTVERLAKQRGTSPPRILVVGALRNEDQNVVQSAVLSVVYENGALRVEPPEPLVRVPPVPGPGVRNEMLGSIDVDEQGAWIAAGDDWVVTATAIDAPPRAQYTEGVSYTAVTMTRDPSQPHLLGNGTTNSLVGDASLGMESMTVVPLPRAQALRYLSTVFEDGVPTTYGRMDRPGIIKWNGSDWDELPILLPRFASPCGNLSCGRTEPAEDVVGIGTTGEPGVPLVILEKCKAIAWPAEPPNLCFRAGAVDAETVERQLSDFESLDQLGDRILLSVHKRRLVEARR